MADIKKVPYPKGYYRIPGSKKKIGKKLKGILKKKLKGIPKPKRICPSDKKGQMLVVGLMIMSMAIILFIALLPAIKSVMDDARGCDYLNCADFVDKDATNAANCGSTNQTYNSTFDEDKLACTILDLGIPYLILGVLVALIAKLISGRLVEPVQEAPPQYGYGGY